MPLEDIVNVQISLETQAVTQAAFDVVCIVGPNATFSARTGTYSSLTALAADLTGGVNALEYKAASAIFAQNPHPTTFKIGKTLIGDTDITDSLTKINTEDSAWFGLVLADRTKANQLLAAAWAESNNKVAGFASEEADIINKAYGTGGGQDSPTTGTLAAQLKGDNLYRSFCMYTPDDEQWPEAALFGRVLPYNPGSYTTKFKTLAGITAAALTTTQETNALGKNCFIYTEVGGVNITQEGKVAAGEFLDVIIFRDFLQSRIKENVYGLLVRSKKVPFDDGGIQGVAARVAQILDVGITYGGITAPKFNDEGVQTGGYVITTPSADSISANDKAARYLQGISFVAYLAGAIHATRIDGVLTL